MPPLVPELSVSDVETSKKFYKEILGFVVKYERPDEGFAYLERQGAELMLDQIGKTRDWMTASLEKPFGRGINFQIETSHVEQLYTSIKETAGDAIFLEIETKHYKVGDSFIESRQFLVQDPDGYLLRFFEDIENTHA